LATDEHHDVHSSTPTSHVTDEEALIVVAAFDGVSQDRHPGVFPCLDAVYDRGSYAPCTHATLLVHTMALGRLPPP
jgi:hypothetical protein